MGWIGCAILADNSQTIFFIFDLKKLTPQHFCPCIFDTYYFSYRWCVYGYRYIQLFVSTFYLVWLMSNSKLKIPSLYHCLQFILEHFELNKYLRFDQINQSHLNFGCFVLGYSKRGNKGLKLYKTLKKKNLRILSSKYEPYFCHIS